MPRHNFAINYIAPKVVFLRPEKVRLIEEKLIIIFGISRKILSIKVLFVWGRLLKKYYK
jgi:hypothetical protein